MTEDKHDMLKLFNELSREFIKEMSNQGFIFFITRRYKLLNKNDEKVVENLLDWLRNQKYVFEDDAGEGITARDKPTGHTFTITFYWRDYKEGDLILSSWNTTINYYELLLKKIGCELELLYEYPSQLHSVFLELARGIPAELAEKAYISGELLRSLFDELRVYLVTRGWI